MDESEDIQRLLDELGDDVAATASRVAVCEVIGQALAHVGRVLGVAGHLMGPDRRSGASPFRFGDDGAVGVATVAQIAGELATGAVDLLKAGNLYAGSALIRQVVEVEYLASAFAKEHDIAAAWLRADRKERLSFWSPSKLRERAGGVFLASDYSHHCELGGHPTTRAMRLLPDHATLNVAYLWVDLAGHLVRVWEDVIVSIERWLGGVIPAEWNTPDVGAAIEAWRSTDGLNAAMRDLGAMLREQADGE